MRRAGRLVTSAASRAMPSGSGREPPPGGGEVELPLVAGGAAHEDVEPEAERDREQPRDRGQRGVRARQRRAELRRRQADGLEHAVVARVLAHGEQRDRHERRQREREQHAVEDVDDGPQPRVAVVRRRDVDAVPGHRWRAPTPRAPRPPRPRRAGPSSPAPRRRPRPRGRSPRAAGAPAAGGRAGRGAPSASGRGSGVAAIERATREPAGRTAPRPHRLQDAEPGAAPRAG